MAKAKYITVMLGLLVMMFGYQNCGNSRLNTSSGEAQLLSLDSDGVAQAEVVVTDDQDELVVDVPDELIAEEEVDPILPEEEEVETPATVVNPGTVVSNPGQGDVIQSGVTPIYSWMFVTADGDEIELDNTTQHLVLRNEDLDLSLLEGGHFRVQCSNCIIFRVLIIRVVIRYINNPQPQPQPPVIGMPPVNGIIVRPPVIGEDERPDFPFGRVVQPVVGRPVIGIVRPRPVIGEVERPDFPMGRVVRPVIKRREIINGMPANPGFDIRRLQHEDGGFIQTE